MWLPLHRQPNYLAQKKIKKAEKWPSFLMHTPKTEKIDGINQTIAGLEIGHSSIQGYRTEMEDSFIIEPIDGIENHVMVAIFDGHAGNQAAHYASVRLREVLEETEEWNTYQSLSESERSIQAQSLLGSALVNSYLKIDDEMLDSDLIKISGCTAVVSVITPNWVICANVGDSRCVIGSGEKVISMTEDHKPSLPDEKRRIMAAGGFVLDDRVDGNLAMSRALGDFPYKLNPKFKVHEQKVISVPDISSHRRSPQDSLMVLACDGVWDVLQNEESISLLNPPSPSTSTASSTVTKTIPISTSTSISTQNKKRKNTNEDEDESEDEESLLSPEDMTSEQLAELLIETALNLESTDNISAVVVKFK